MADHYVHPPDPEWYRANAMLSRDIDRRYRDERKALKRNCEAANLRISLSMLRGIRAHRIEFWHPRRGLINHYPYARYVEFGEGPVGRVSTFDWVCRMLVRLFICTPCGHNYEPVPEAGLMWCLSCGHVKRVKPCQTCL